MVDPVCPNTEEAEAISTKSYSLWTQLKHSALEDFALSLERIRLRDLLGPVPAYLGNGRYPSNVEFTIHENSHDQGSELYFNGHSVWETANNGSCTLPPRELPHQILYAV
jgi:hypothetical protein